MANEEKPTAQGEAKTNEEAEPQKEYMDSAQFNKAATARENRFRKELDASLETKLAGVVEKITSLLTPKASEEVEEAEEGEAKGQAADKAKTSTEELRVKRMLSEIKKTQKQVQDEREKQKKEAEEREARDTRSLTLAALTGAGVVAAKQALAVLAQDKRVQRDANGELVFIVQREAGGEKYDEQMPLEQGVKEWLESEDGRIFQPPRGVEGSGALPNSGARVRRSLSPAEKKAEAAKTLLGLFKN